MRTARLLTGTALAVAAVGLAGSAASASDTSALEVLPGTATPGTTVSVNTAACGAGGTAQGDASAVGAGLFSLAPSAHEDQATGQFKVPPSAQPGTYEIVAKCTDGRQVAGDLVVTMVAGGQQVQPRGSLKTGVGGALGPDPLHTAAGVAALAVAAAGGTWLLHRRARGEGF
ncbi:hypothetical protein ACWCP6_01835 [Streptomyces sp. NPDC002004]